MTHTYARTHVHTDYSDPYLVCSACEEPVTGFHHDDEHACGCGVGNWLVPCEHDAKVVSTCPSWSPVDGCSCLPVLGSAKHAVPRTQ